MSENSYIPGNGGGSTQLGRRLTAVATGTTLALAVGALATWRADEGEGPLTFLVFALVTCPALLAGAWLLLVDVAAEPAIDHPEDTIESSWTTRASAGAFTDLVIAMGLALAVTSILDAPEVPIVVFVVLALADVTLRYLAMSRREA